MGKGRVRVTRRREKKKQRENTKWANSVHRQNEISHEPRSESAPTSANGSEQRKPEGEGRHEGHPDLERSPDKYNGREGDKSGTGVNPKVF